MKPSTSIRPRQTREILRAGRHAWRLERGFNRFVVITFHCPLNDELKPHRQFRAIRTKAASWLYYKRRERFMDPLTDVRTWEHVGDRYHVNWALHVPSGYEAEFEEKLPIWIEKVLGAEMADETYQVREVYHLNGLLKYMLKGTQGGHAHRFGIRPTPQGEVWGRRAVAANCLGRAARARDQENGTVAV
jgi:hypothetical protein